MGNSVWMRFAQTFRIGQPFLFFQCGRNTLELEQKRFHGCQTHKYCLSLSFNFTHLGSNTFSKCFIKTL